MFKLPVEFRGTVKELFFYENSVYCVSLKNAIVSCFHVDRNENLETFAADSSAEFTCATLMGTCIYIFPKNNLDRTVVFDIRNRVFLLPKFDCSEEAKSIYEKSTARRSYRHKSSVYLLYTDICCVLRVNLSTNEIKVLHVPQKYPYYDMKIIGDLCYLIPFDTREIFVWNMLSGDFKRVSDGGNEPYFRIALLGDDIYLYSKCGKNSVLSEGQIFETDINLDVNKSIASDKGVYLLPWSDDRFAFVSYGMETEYFMIAEPIETILDEGFVMERNSTLCDFISYIAGRGN
ncbi:hypothetical protein [Butyrivibrio sp. AE3003]|uniref:hypothetical protein n=1 Tax=Butyrivibrio sp. AE3003 TaxID=1496721 RepID=UPI000ACD894B|nr:hypothetical protein [Butyrivibrio sp. AE3003]